MVNNIQVWEPHMNEWLVGEDEIKDIHSGNILVWDRDNARLPKAYQEVEYIESSWTQYINTNVQLWTNIFEINCDALITTFTTEEQGIFSIWTETYLYRNVFVRNQNSTRYLDVCFQWHNQIDTSLSTNIRYNITLKRTSSNTWNLQNNSNSINITYSPSSTNNTTVKLFTRWDTPSTSYSNSKIRMYSCTIKMDWILVRDFVPCIRDSDWVIWMYDLITKQFFTNSWTGNFVAGPIMIRDWRMP